MTSKHYGWHKSWRREAPDVLVHDSGLRVHVQEAEDGALDVETEDASLQAYQQAEMARGVPLHDLQARLQRLLREAAEWHDRNP